MFAMSTINMQPVFFNLVAFLSLIGSGAVDWAQEITDPNLMQPKSEDEEWADYIKELEPDYDEVRGFPEITTSNPEDNFFSQKLNFTVTGKGEVPFMAVIYQLLEGETELDGGARSGVRRQRACGAVLVATDRLITPCGCVISYFGTYYADIKPKHDEASGFPFDLGWATTGKYLFYKINRIFVQYGLHKYYTGKDMPGLKDPSKDMHLIEKPEKTDENGDPLPIKLTIDQECYDIARSTWRQDGELPFVPKNYLERANHALALVPFTPEIKFTVPGQVIPWPPQVFNDITTELRTPFYEEQVVVSGMGYEKRVFGRDCPRPWRIVDDEGNDLPLEKISINIPMKHCVIRSTKDETTCPRSFSLPDQYYRLSCFCDLYQPKITPAEVGCKVIHNGTIGWPIVYNGNVVALTASPRNPYVEGNRILGSSLAFPDFRKHVEETLTQEGIEKQRTNRPPMFREDVEHWSVVFYDYPEMPQWYVHAGTTPKFIEFALADHFGPHPTLAPLLSVIAYFA